jgi:hypothetical protein
VAIVDLQGRPFSFVEWGKVHHLYLELRHGSANYMGKVDQDEFELFYEAYLEWKAGKITDLPTILMIGE